MPDVTVFDAIHSLRAVREYLPDPVPDDALARILRAGTMACSSGNTQPWEFLVLTDPGLRGQVQDWMAEAFSHVDATRSQPDEQLKDGVGRPITGHAAVRNIGTVPAIILVFWNPDRGIRFKNEYEVRADGTVAELRPGAGGRGSSVFPACQNMMLAAKALGIGSLFTTFLRLVEDNIKGLLDVPPRMFLEAAIFVGYPAEKLGSPKRRPIEEVARKDRWENLWRDG